MLVPANPLTQLTEVIYPGTNKHPVVYTGTLMGLNLCLKGSFSLSVKSKTKADA